MNLVSSKLLKSSRQVFNRSLETAQAYSCELYIDSFKVSHRGFVYFLWYSNTTQINSLRYEANGKTVPVKETLTISIRMTSKNGKEQPFNTYIKLMAESGEELDEFELPVNGLSSHYRDIEVPMDRGLCNIKVRRKQMNVGDEVEVSHQRMLYRSRNTRMDENKSIMSGGGGGEYESLQEELNRIKKELQDEVYLNNKLKNDRDVLMATKQELQIDIETMIVQTTKEIKTLREHYDNRISIRQHSYQQQIQNLVNMVNADATHSKKVMDLLMKQKIKFEDELKIITEKLSTHEHDIQSRDERILELQELLEQHKQRVMKLEGDIEEKTKEFDIFTADHESIKIELEEHIRNLEQELVQNKEKLGNQETELSQLHDKTQQLEFQVKNKDVQIASLEEALKASQQKEETMIRESDLLHKENQLKDDEKKSLAQYADSLRQKLQECQFQMQFNENVISQLKKQHMQKEEQLYQQLQNLQKIYQKKLQDLLANYQTEKQKNQGSQVIQKEKIQLESRVQDLQNIADGSELKIKELSEEISKILSQVETTKKQSDQREKNVTDLEAEIKKLKEENASLTQTLVLKKQKSSPPSSPRDRQKSIGKEIAEDLKNKIKELQQQNAVLSQELTTVKVAADKKETEMKELKDQLNKFYEGEIILSETKRLNISGEKEIQGIPSIEKKEYGVGEEEVHMLLSQKENEVEYLKRKIDQLQNLYEYLQQRLDKIIEMYPNVDMTKIDAQIPPVIERCESEQEEEQRINEGISIQNQFVQTPNSPHNFTHIQGYLLEPELSKRSSEKHVYEPRSETRIKIPIEGSVKNSPKISIPKGGNSLKKKVSIAGSNKEDLSQKSGGSWVKVSHSQKIRDMEKLIRQLENKEKQYIRQMQGYKLKIENMEAELRMKKKQFLTNENSLSPTFRPGSQVPKVNTESQVLLEDERVKNLIEDCKSKQADLNKKDSKIGELEEQVKQNNQQKMELSNKIFQLQQRISEFTKEFDRSQKEWLKKLEAVTDANKQLQKEMAQLQQKLRKQKENAQEARLSLKELTLHYDNVQAEVKKLRSQNQTLEEKVYKLSGTQLVIRELSKEIEDMGKKSLEQTRTLNHLKLEKDSIDEQLRLVKKRQTDQARIAAEWQEKAASLERTIEEFKRKENKLKREIQDGHEQVRRSKLQQKKLEDELQALSTAQIGWQVERRKYLDEISSLQDQLSRKDYDMTKLNKEIERWKSKSEERDDLRLGKKSELRQEIERLENEMIRRDKKLLQETEENKLLRGRLEVVERQNKRIMEQKNQTYGQKLKFYVQQMSSIKKLLEEYQNENSRLKIDNNELYEQYEMLRSNSDKLQMRYEESMAREEDIMTDLQSYMDEVNILKQKLSQTQREISSIEMAFSNLRKETDQQKNRSKKIAEKLQNSQRDLQNSQNQMRDLKLKLNEYETNFQINGKISERYKLLQRKKTELEEDWKRLKAENENLKSTYPFTREDLQKAVGDVRNQERRMREEQVHRLEEESNKAISSKTQRLEQELLEVYNENNKNRTDLQILHEENGRQKGRIIELEILCEKVNSLQGQNQYLRNEIEMLKEELKKKSETIGKTQITIEGMQSQYNLKERELNGLRSRIKDLQANIQKLNQEIKIRRNAEKQLQQALIRSSDQKGKQKNDTQLVYKQRQMDLVREFQSKIRTLEVELQKAKDRESKLLEENSHKMKKLEEKMDEMEEALRQKERAMEGHYQAQVHELENSLIKLSDELKQKMGLIDELNQAIIVLEGDNVDLSKQMQDLNYKHEDQRHLLQNELNKLKMKFKEAQTSYSANLKTLQEEMIRATQIKVNNTASSRVKTNEAEDRVSKRYEDKLKTKDKKIEELKQNIYTLQQTILKLKKKENVYETTLNELQRYKMTFSNYEKQKKKTELEWESELTKHGEIVRELKKEILRLKEDEQHARLTCQQKILQNEGILCQLKTIRELYQELQRQLERRKNNLTMQLQEESSLQYQLRMQQSKITELEERILEYIKNIKDLQLENKKKNSQLKRNADLMEQMNKIEHQYRAEIQKLTKEVSTFKQELNDASTSCESARSELKYSKAEISRLKKVHQDLKLCNQSKEEEFVQLKRINDQLITRYRDYEETARKYSMLNERSRDELGCSIEQLLQRYSVVIEQKDAQTNMLVEEIEELKFLNERKYMDYDEMKKTNFELQLKVEEYQNLSDQLETLRKICDKLEEEKKNSVFKEEVLRMQIENVASSAPQDIKSRIQSILSTPIVPSYSNFSFY